MTGRRSRSADNHTGSDRYGRARLPWMLLACHCRRAPFTLLPGIDHFAVLLLPVAVIALCYGGGFGTMPAFSTDVFGAKNAGTIYGAMLTAWSAGAIVGPLLIVALPYRTALALIAGMLALAAALPLLFSALARHGDAARADKKLNVWTKVEVAF